MSYLSTRKNSAKPSDFNLAVSNAEIKTEQERKIILFKVSELP